MKKILLLIFFCFSILIGKAQEDIKSIAILTFNYFPSKPDFNSKKATEYSSIVARQFVLDGRFSVVERARLGIIEQERELQKSEDFIDGKVVQQGAGIGADYLLTGYCDFGTNILTLSIYDVASGLLIGKEDFDLQLDYKLKSFVHQKLIQRYFPMPNIKLVKILTGNNNAATVLIAAGSKSGLISKEKLEVVELIYEEVNGESTEREVAVGRIKVDQIENENFTNCKVLEGGRFISEKLSNGKNLFCKRSIE